MCPSVRLALIGACLSLFTFSASAQTSRPSAQIRLVGPSGRPLPGDFFVVRNARGNEIHARRGGFGQFAFVNVGRKISLEFTRKGLKTTGIELVLEDAPLVYVTVIVDPETGRVKSVSQKAQRPPIEVRSPGGARNLGPAQPSTPVETRPTGKLLFPGGTRSNDAAANALPIDEGATLFSTIDATTDGAPDPTGQFDGQTYADVWYLYRPSSNGLLVLSTCGLADYDTDLVLYDADADGNGIHDAADCLLITSGACPPLASNDDAGICDGFTSQLSAQVSVERTYLVRVGGGMDGDQGSGTLILSQEGGPANDACDAALTLTCDSSLDVTNVAATTGMLDPEFSCAFGKPMQGTGTLWFSFTASTTSALLTTAASTGAGDTLLAVYDGSCGNLVELACDDDGGPGLLSELCVSGLVVGNTYLVQVASFPGSDLGDITLGLECPGPCDIPCDDVLAACDLACGSEITIDNSLAGTDALDPQFSCGLFGALQGTGTLWFSFVASDSTARIDTNSSVASDTLLAVYSGMPGAFTELACSDDEGVGLLSEVLLEGLSVGQRYYVQAASFDEFSTGPITLRIQCPGDLSIANDICEGAIPLSLPASVTVDLTGATDDILESCELFAGPFQNVWYRVTGTGNVLSASTCNAGTQVFDTKISVFCADCGGLVCVTGNDDDCPSGGPGFAAAVRWCSQEGADYLVTVGTFSATTPTGPVQLDVFEGSACEGAVQCLPAGACCLRDGTCVTATAEDCRGMGGIYQGDDSDCFEEFVADGGFEGGAPGSAWTEFSTNFPSLLCDATCGSGGSVTPPRSGLWWAWFGGSNLFEEGSIEQMLVIPTGASTLELFLKIPVSSGNGVDFVRLQIDGITLFEALENDVLYQGDVYMPISIPLGAFADGGMHTLRIEGVTLGPEITNFFFDDLSISVLTFDCPECVTLDFDTEDDFSTLLGNGQTISTPPEFGTLVSISASGLNAGAGIFDSTPGGANAQSQDRDLLVGRGNLLVLQNNLVPEESAGFYDRPNDDQDGGDLFFDFVVPVAPDSIVLVDIDIGSSQASSVVLTDVNLRTRTYAVPAEWTEDILINGGSGWRKLDLTTLDPQPGFASTATAMEEVDFDPSQVMSIQVHLGSSGAVDDLEFCR